MSNDQICTSFDRVIEYLEELLSALNQYGSTLLEEQKYQQAREVISKAERVLSHQNLVRDLRDEWIKMDSPVTDVGEQLLEDPEGIPREFNNMLRSEPHTDNKAIKMPILTALVNLGGRARRKELFAELEKVMANEFTETDFKTLPSDDKTTVWQNIAAHALQNLKKEGLLSMNKLSGYWVISEKGNEILEKEKKRNQNGGQ